MVSRDDDRVAVRFVPTPKSGVDGTQFTAYRLGLGDGNGTCSQNFQRVGSPHGRWRSILGCGSVKDRGTERLAIGKSLTAIERDRGAPSRMKIFFVQLVCTAEPCLLRQSSVANAKACRVEPVSGFSLE